MRRWPDIKCETYATNLTTGLWFTLATNTAAANGLVTVQDPTATNDQRFYRVSAP